MYVTKKLFDAINESYFRNYQDTELRALPKNFDALDIIAFEGNMNTMMNQGFKFPEGQNSLLNLLSDLRSSIAGKPLEDSMVGREAQRFVTNMSFRVSDHFRNERLDSVTLEVMNYLKYFSPESCMVGGCVRDMLIGRKPKDFDFVTDIPYDKLKWIFEEKGFTIKETGKNFLVLNVIKDGVETEIANFRKDGTYEDGRRPEEVSIGTIHDDAQRRDLTVNALYYNLTTSKIVDPTALGLDDIQSKTLRFVGRATDRLNEDSLRAYRFLRFVGKGFTPEPKSLRAVRTQFIDDNKKLKTLQELATKANLKINLTDFERIRGEIEKMVGL